MSWTDDRVNLLKQLWGEGKTAAEIAKALGEGVTRNAVIGKAHRLKLSSRVSPIQQNTKKQKSEAPKPRRVVQPIPEFKGKGVSLVDLKPGMCRWPVGDPKEENFNFCGCKSLPGLPYCEHHAKLAYQVSSRSRTLNADDFPEDAGTPQDFEIKTAVNE